MQGLVTSPGQSLRGFKVSTKALYTQLSPRTIDYYVNIKGVIMQASRRNFVCHSTNCDLFTVRFVIVLE